MPGILLKMDKQTKQSDVVQAADGHLPMRENEMRIFRIIYLFMLMQEYRTSNIIKLLRNWSYLNGLSFWSNRRSRNPWSSFPKFILLRTFLLFFIMSISSYEPYESSIYGRTGGLTYSFCSLAQSIELKNGCSRTWFIPFDPNLFLGSLYKSPIIKFFAF